MNSIPDLKPCPPWRADAKRLTGVLHVAIGASFACLLTLADATAAEPPKPAVNKTPAKAAAKPADSKPAAPLLNRNQLRECLAQQDRVKEQNAEAARLQADLEREKAEILKDGEALKAELTSLDRSDAPAVEAYNARATARDLRIDGFEPRVTAFNAKVEALNADRAAFTRDCDNRKFDERDEKALKR